MRRPLRGLAIVTLLITMPACAEEEPDPGPECTEIVCGGGFDLWLTSADATSAFIPGDYDVFIEFGENGDDGELAIDCDVDASGGGSCGPVEWTKARQMDFVVTAAYGVPPAQEVIETPAIQVHIEVHSEADAGTNVAGPTDFEVDVDRDTRRVGLMTYTPTYTRDDEFNGPPECGYCESRVLEILRLDPS